MTRTAALATVIGVGAITASLGAYQAAQAPAPKVVEAQKIKDNLYMLTGNGGGGNTAVFIRANDVVVVDTKNPGWGTPVLNKIKELTPKPVTTIINTHTHGDHVSGNVEFPATVDVVVQENTKVNMQQMKPPSFAAATATPATNIFTQNAGRGMAKRTFTDRMTLGSGADRIELYYFGRGHTNGDAFVLFPALRVVHAGDIFSGKNLPNLDMNNGGSAKEIGNSLAKAADTIKDVDVVITGHSTLMTPADLREYAQFNTEFFTQVETELRAGKSVDAIAASWKIDPKYKGYAMDEARLKRNVQNVADESK